MKASETNKWGNEMSKSKVKDYATYIRRWRSKNGYSKHERSTNNFSRKINIHQPYEKRLQSNQSDDCYENSKDGALEHVLVD